MDKKTVRVQRNREQVISDGKIAARWIAKRINDNPTYKGAGDALGKTKGVIKRDVETFLKWGDDQTLINTINNWRQSHNRAVPRVQREALCDLYIEIRDSAHRWGFSDHHALCAALGIPVWTMRKWKEDYRPSDEATVEFKQRTTYGDSPEGLLTEHLGGTKIEHQRADIEMMRLTLLQERLEAIRALQGE